MKVNFRVDGFKELTAGLAQFKKSTQAGVLSRTLRKAAKPVADTAQQMVPKRTHELEQSIGVAVVKNNAGKAAYAEAMRNSATKAQAAQAARDANRAAAGNGASATVLVGTGLWRAHFVEFGTRKAPAQPFMRPALAAKEREAIGIIKTTLGQEIEATARRIAKRKPKGK